MTTSPAARPDAAGPPSVPLAERFFSKDEIERSRAYHRPLYPLVALSTALSIGFLAAAVFSPLGRWLAAPVDSLPRWAFALSFTAIVTAAGAVLRFPVAFWRGYRHEHRWGFSTQSLRGWLLDWAKGLGVQVVLLSLLMLGLVELAGTMHDAWPLGAAPAAAAVVVFLSFVQPVVLEPLFNRFRPLEDAELAGSVFALAERAGTPVRDVLVADASRRTHKENAYVSGLGRTRRVVASGIDLSKNRSKYLARRRVDSQDHFDGIEESPAWNGGRDSMGSIARPDDLLSGVELEAIVLGAISAASAADPRVIPFVLLVGEVLELVTMPFLTALSRRWEAAADRFGIGLTGDADGYAEMARNLGTTNLADLTPSRPAYYLLFTHPSIPERIDAALNAERPKTA